MCVRTYVCVVGVLFHCCCWTSVALVGASEPALPEDGPGDAGAAEELSGGQKCVCLLSYHFNTHKHFYTHTHILPHTQALIHTQALLHTQALHPIQNFYTHKHFTPYKHFYSHTNISSHTDRSILPHTHTHTHIEMTDLSDLVIFITLRKSLT